MASERVVQLPLRKAEELVQVLDELRHYLERDDCS
jgi:hypothetical protein